MKKTVLAVVISMAAATTAHATNLDVINFFGNAKSATSIDTLAKEYSSMDSRDKGIVDADYTKAGLNDDFINEIHNLSSHQPAPGHFVPTTLPKVEDPANANGNVLRRAIINKAETNEALAHEARYKGMLTVAKGDIGFTAPQEYNPTFGSNVVDTLQDHQNQIEGISKEAAENFTAIDHDVARVEDKADAAQITADTAKSTADDANTNATTALTNGIKTNAQVTANTTALASVAGDIQKATTAASEADAHATSAKNAAADADAHAGIAQAQAKHAESHAQAAYEYADQNRKSLKETNERVSANSSEIADHEQRIETLESNTNSKLANLDKKVDDNRKRASAGIAGVAAMANIPQVTQGQTFAVGAGVGTTDGESALAVGASSRLNDNWVVKASVSDDTQNNFVVGAGASYGW